MATTTTKNTANKQAEKPVAAANWATCIMHFIYVWAKDPIVRNETRQAAQGAKSFLENNLGSGTDFAQRAKDAKDKARKWYASIE